MTPRHAVPVRPRTVVAGILALVMSGSLVLAAAVPVSASTTTYVADRLVGWVNQARAARGLRALRVDPRLSALATERARVLADAALLDHGYPGDIGRQLDARGIQWYRYGEVLAWSSATFGYDSAYAIYRAWRGSPSHWSLLMSDDYNYFGPGIALRSANAATYASIVLTESVDHSAPTSRFTATSRSGTTITWWWRGWEPPLQTHTAGLRDFDVQYRVDSGAWRNLKNGTTMTYLRLYGRLHGHTYSIRVRARDRRGNVGAWTLESRISVP